MNAGRVAILLALVAVPAAGKAQETVDLAVVHRIKAEAFQGGQVMDHLFYLTDVDGPRLTASPAERAAAEWAIARLKQWGIASARTEPWGSFGRSWTLERYAAHMQFIQDPLDYMTRTHHSDVDAYDHVQGADLMQAAAIVASFVYDAATREGLLPREPLPKPLPPPRRDAAAR